MYERTSLKMVGGAGFEPTKSKTTDLQSAPFDRFGIPPITVINVLQRLTKLPRSSSLVVYYEKDDVVYSKRVLLTALYALW